MNSKDTKVFSCNSNKNLAKKIAKSLNLNPGKAKVLNFSDGEISICLEESVRGSDCFVVQSTCPPVNDNLMELLIMIDAMKRASASNIAAVIPYFGYARQDRKSRTREAISAKLVADLITVSGANRILTMDLHAPQIQGFFNIPVDNLLGSPLLASAIRDEVPSWDASNFVVVSPDLGSVTRARSFAERLLCPLAIIDKRRPRSNVCEIMNIIGDVKNKNVILIDDMIDTAGTLCNAAEAVVKKGGALSVFALATHAILSGPAVEKINDSFISKIILLDTIPCDKKINKDIKIISSYEIFAEAIKRIQENRPVSTMFI